MESVAANLWLTKDARERLEAASKAFARAVCPDDQDAFTWSPEPGETELLAWREILTKK